MTTTRSIHNWCGSFRKGASIALAIVMVCMVLAGCGEGTPEGGRSGGAESVEAIADIQAGIEKHIDDKTLAGGGKFDLRFDEKTLSLKLVRVHTEYLAKLGPKRHFACVDLVDVSGDVYDVDFFLEGDPGAMTVTETTVHKINGQPYYAWKQSSDGTWGRVFVEDFTPGLLGVVMDRDAFEFLYRATLPEITGKARMWLPLASTDAFQTVAVESIETPAPHRVLEDPAYGNKVLFLELDPGDSGKQIAIRYTVRRIEKAAYASDEPDPQRHLQPERLVPANETFSSLAEGVVKGKKGDLVRARAIYDHVIDRMRYIKYGQGWGKGDAVYACDAKTGNCTDFHAYFISLARAAGIPARFAIGAAIPSERNEGGVDGYHCWAEFHAEGKWWPIDISEADKYSSLSTYYFGHHPANRLEFSRGRDLQVDPGPESGPINFLAYPVLEIAGKPVKAKVWFSFNRIAAGEAAGD